MNALQRHDRLMAFFDEACDLEPDAQAAFIDRLQGDEPELAFELAALLHHDRVASDTLEACVAPPSLRLSGLSGFMKGSISLDESISAAHEDVGPLIPSVPDLEVVATLAEGGMGRVLLAHQRSLNRQVAMKVLRRRALSNRGCQSLFEEARLAGSLEHPNIVPVHLVAEDRNGLPVLVMKRIEGVSWRVLLDEPKHDVWEHLLHEGTDRLSVHMSILSSVCHAIHYAHTRGVIHCDIKPDNVMVGGFGEVYVVDWGIARQLSTPAPHKADKMLGTPGFMAPEMVRGSSTALDARTDVYLLGATLHYVLTGELRHPGRTVAEQCLNAVQSRSCCHGPDVPADLATICTRATAADPAERFPTADAFRQALAQYVRNRGSIELSDSAWNRLEKLPGMVAEGTEAGVMDEYLTECQFAFHQSLRTWPGNSRARRGLAKCLHVMVEHEIQRESVGRAKALLQQIGNPDPTLAKRVAELESRVFERQASAARLQDVERSMDWSVHTRARASFFIIAKCLIVLIWRWSVRNQDETHEMPPHLMAFYSGVVIVVMAALCTIFRRRIFANTISRNFMLGVFCVAGFGCVNRALNVVSAPMTASILSGDHVIAAAIAAMGGLTLARWIWFFVPVMLFGALFSRVLPNQADNIFALTTICCCYIGLYATRPSRAEEIRRE